MPKKLILPNEDFTVVELSTPEYDRWLVIHKISGRRAYGITEAECFNGLLTELSELYKKKVIKEP